MLYIVKRRKTKEAFLASRSVLITGTLKGLISAFSLIFSNTSTAIVFFSIELACVYGSKGFFGTYILIMTQSQDVCLLI